MRLMKLQAPSQTISAILWVVAMGTTVYGSLVPRLAPPNEYGIDKLIHFGVYCFLAFVPTLSFNQAAARWAALITTFISAVGIEIAQAFVAGRTSSIHDVISSALGMLSGILAAMALRRRWERAKQRT